MSSIATPAFGRRRLRWSRLVIYGVMITFLLFFLLPVYLLLITSFKSFDQVSLSRMWDLPTSFSLESFNRAWNGGEGVIGMRGSFWNSVQLVVPATVISCILGSLNGYVLSKWRFPGSETLFTLILFGMFIPYQSVLVPLVEILREMRLYATIPGLILVHVVYGIPITTLIFRNYYATVPNELVEAGKIDGADFFGIYRHVMLPLSAPGFVVVAIWQFTSIWNEFLFGLIITNDPQLRPVTVALQNLSGSQFTQWNVQMAGALLVALPPLLVYVFLGKYFLRGMTGRVAEGVEGYIDMKNTADKELSACTPAPVRPECFNHTCNLPYGLTAQHVHQAMKDFVDFLDLINSQFCARGMLRLELFLMPATFSGMVGEFITARIPEYCRGVVKNRHHNGHPDLIPFGKFPEDSVQYAQEGVEVKASRYTSGW
ncbi:MAG: hypothetical protein KatS3mg058_1523 [Roseiflexus sp.]|nr:carbohydrate ABC transporter permease [Roseiflexus sp.]GIW00120.1 MAG: hypothetical protein KatS3mg058_1523 [Roseiflexus sp.]